MKARMNLVFAALVVMLGAMTWVVADRSSPVSPAAAMAIDATPVRVSAVPQPAPAVPDIALPARNAASGATSVAAASTPPSPAIETPILTPAKTAPLVRIDPAGGVKYVARAGDTISQLAVALLGSDSRENRQAVVDVNPSLKANPDLVLEGETYVMTAAPMAVAADAEAAGDKPSAPDDIAVAAPEVAHSGTPVADAADRSSAGAPKLTYIAQPGDSVAILAGNLLGGDTQSNRKAIIAANPSLKENPDHLVAGQTYTIVAANGLAADPSAVQAKAPAIAPDADEAAKLSVGRTLRYTAQPGDTVSRLATALLGSDTPDNRELIIKSNASLKQDPDHLVAGQTYWIAAPIAEATR